jgi:hypothetical protein
MRTFRDRFKEDRLQRRALGIGVGAAFVGAALIMTAARTIATSRRQGDPPRAAGAYSAADQYTATGYKYSHAVTRICAGALLFDHSHRMGTRSDALAVARDIGASTARRLKRVTALPIPPKLRPASSRWISSQRQLAAMFARTWVRIYDTIDAARTRAQRATLANRLEQLVHAPDQLKLAAGRLERRLHVPDCTGGG